MSKTNESLLQRRAAAVPRGVGQIHPIVAERAENATVWDVEGREYIDFAGGIAVLNTGHLHPKVVAAVQEQLTKLTHTCFQVLAYEPYIELCEEIAKRVEAKPEPVYTFRLEITGTKEALRRMKEFGLVMGIAFKNIDKEAK